MNSLSYQLSMLCHNDLKIYRKERRDWLSYDKFFQREFDAIDTVSLMEKFQR